MAALTGLFPIEETVGNITSAHTAYGIVAREQASVSVQRFPAANTHAIMKVAILRSSRP